MLLTRYAGLLGPLDPSQGFIAITLGRGIFGGKLMSMSCRLLQSSYVELHFCVIWCIPSCLCPSKRQSWCCRMAGKSVGSVERPPRKSVYRRSAGPTFIHCPNKTE